MAPRRTALPSLLLLPLLAHAYPGGGGSSIAVGDLTSPGNTPFGISQSAFKSAVSHANATGSFKVSGYNISAPAGQGDGGGNEVSGWTLGISITADVSLSSSSHGPGGDVTDLTVLSLAPPDAEASKMDGSWRLCAIVYTGVAPAGTEQGAGGSGNSGNNQTDGTCGQLLPSACIKELTVLASSQGVTATGTCSSQGLPGPCKGYFATGVNSTAFALDKSTLSNKEFYAFGSAPTSSGNETAWKEAASNVWPVVVTWAHLSSGGQIAAANAEVYCARATSQGTGTSGGGGTSGTGTGTSSPSATHSTAAGVAGPKWPLVLLVLAAAVLVL